MVSEKSKREQLRKRLSTRFTAAQLYESLLRYFKTTKPAYENHYGKPSKGRLITRMKWVDLDFMFREAARYNISHADIKSEWDKFNKQKSKTSVYRKIVSKLGKRKIKK